MPFSAKIEGTKELRRKFARMSKVMKNKVVRPAMDFAMTPMNKSAKRRAPVGKGPEAGLLRKSIGKLVRVYPKAVVGLIGPRTNFKREIGTTKKGKRIFKNPVNYAHLVELGTKTAAKKEFLQPALTSQREKFLKRLGSKVNENIVKVAKKAK